MNGRARLLWRLLGLLRPWWGWMALGMLLALVSTLAGIGLLTLSGWFIASMAIAGAGGVALNYFTPAALIRGFAILRSGGRYLERLVTHEATLRALGGLRIWLFARLLPLAPARTGVLRDAELFSRLRADIDGLEHLYLAVLVPLAVALAALPLVVILQAFYLWPVALLTLLLALLAGVLLPWWAWHRGEVPGARTIEQAAALRAAAADALQGAAELALYGGEAMLAARIAGLTADQQDARATLDGLQARAGALVPLAAQLAAAGSVLLGSAALRAGALAAPDLALLALLALAAFEAIAPLPEALAQLGATLTAAARVFALADASPAVTDANPPLPLPARGDLALRDVHLRYAEAAPWALEGVDLDLPQGHRVALLGPSGAGKSSVVAALLRLYPIQHGRITLGGCPLAACRGDDVRAAIAVVEQRTHIFNASLLDNLLLARPDASAAMVEAAVTAAQLDGFVAGLPEGYDTWLGEAGARLSGGEARRVAIARALLADRPILVLDEPTEGLDAVTAQRLYAALAPRVQGRSVLVITHRLGGLGGLVDTVAVMESGRVRRCTPAAAYPAASGSGIPEA